MNSKKLISLAILAIVLGGLAYYTSKSDIKKPTVKSDTLLFEDLPVNDIAEVNISKESESITLSRNMGVWTCPDKQDYPVKFDTIREMILKIANIKTGHLTPADDQQRQEIGMILPPASGSGTLVDMRDAEGNTIESILIGTTRESTMGMASMKYPTGCFVSKDKGKSVYLINDVFTSDSPSPRVWLDSALIKIKPSDIETISIKRPDGETLKLIDEDGTLKPEKLAKDETIDTSAINSLSYLLANLSFDDLAEPGMSDEDLGFADPVTLTAETENGVKYTLKIGNTVKGRAERYARLSAELQAAGEQDSKEETTELTDEEKKLAEEAKKTKEDERRKLQQDVTEMNNRFSKWTYTLAIHKTDSVTLANTNIITKKANDTENKK